MSRLIKREKINEYSFHYLETKKTGKMYIHFFIRTFEYIWNKKKIIKFSFVLFKTNLNTTNIDKVIELLKESFIEGKISDFSFKLWQENLFDLFKTLTKEKEGINFVISEQDTINKLINIFEKSKNERKKQEVKIESEITMEEIKKFISTKNISLKTFIDLYDINEIDEKNGLLFFKKKLKVFKTELKKLIDLQNKNEEKDFQNLYYKNKSILWMILGKFYTKDDYNEIVKELSTNNEEGGKNNRFDLYDRLSGQIVELKKAADVKLMTKDLSHNGVWNPSSAYSKAIQQSKYYRVKCMEMILKSDGENYIHPDLINVILILGNKEKELTKIDMNDRESWNKSFETSRQSIYGINVITHDEIYRKLKNLSKSINTVATALKEE